jgi:hypothetical protein
MFRYILSFFKDSRMDSCGLDPAEFLFDPNITVKPSFFLYTLISWASAVTKPEEVLSGCRVETITYTKRQESPEHEWLVIETVDGSGQIRKFIMDRMGSRQDPAPDPTSDTNESSVLTRSGVLTRIKKFVFALMSLTQPPETPGESSLFDPIVFQDKKSLSIAETAHLLSESFDISNKSLAQDRIMGHLYTTKEHWQGEDIGCLRPVNLSLFELLVVAHVSNLLFPNYAYLKNQCYFFASLIFCAVDRKWGSTETDSAGAGGPSKSGRWKGFKVQTVGEEDVKKVLTKYEACLSETKDRVFLLIHTDQTIAYHSIQHRSQEPQRPVGIRPRGKRSEISLIRRAPRINKVRFHLNFL